VVENAAGLVARDGHHRPFPDTSPDHIANCSATQVAQERVRCVLYGWEVYNGSERSGRRDS
jgi:hypothetical protein